MRINEDYMDIERIDVADTGAVLQQHIIDEMCDVVDAIVRGEYEGERPDFDNFPDAIYPVDDETLPILIKRLREMYGFEDHMNLNWIDVSRVTDMEQLFYVPYRPTGYRSVLNIDVSRWDVRNVVNTSYMFSYSTYDGDLSSWKLDSVDDCSYMFIYSNFSGDLSGWDVSNASKTKHMLSNCPLREHMEFWPKGYEQYPLNI